MRDKLVVDSLLLVAGFSSCFSADTVLSSSGAGVEAIVWAFGVVSSCFCSGSGVVTSTVGAIVDLASGLTEVGTPRVETVHRSEQSMTLVSLEV